MSLYVLKLIATPILIVFASLVARRWGSLIGGAVAGLPFISGPASAFLAYEQGLSFASHAAAATLMAVGAVCCYCITYAYALKKLGGVIALLLSLAVFLSVAQILSLLPTNIAVGSAIALICPALTLKIVPEISEVEQPRHAPPRWHILVQMLCGGLTVFVITECATILGGSWSGILLTFPIISSVMMPFAFLSGGYTAALLTLRGLLAGFVGTSCFTLTVALSLEHLGMAACYGVATILCLVVGTIMTIKGRKKRPALIFASSSQSKSNG